MHNSEAQMDKMISELEQLKALFASHIKEESELKPRLIELLVLLERSKGAVSLLKALIYIGAPLTAITYWIKDHVKL